MIGLWNPRKYNARKSNKEAVGKICGPETYPELLEIAKYLRYFDQYNFTVTPVAAKKIVEIEDNINKLETAFKNVSGYHLDAVYTWIVLPEIVSRPRQFMAKIKAQPDLNKYISNIRNISKRAVKETGYDPENDILLTPYNLAGGGGPGVSKTTNRLNTWIYGKKSRFNHLTSPFTMPGTPENDWELIIMGKNGKNGKMSRLKIVVNNRIVYNAQSPFDNKKYSAHTFIVKSGYLLNDENNVLKIYNTTNSNDKPGSPVVMINYAVLKEKK